MDVGKDRKDKYGNNKGIRRFIISGFNKCCNEKPLQLRIMCDVISCCRINLQFHHCHIKLMEVFYLYEYEYEYDLLFYSLRRTPLNAKPLPYVK